LKARKQAEELIRFLCSCGKRVKVSPKFAGKVGKCPKCGKPVQIPPIEILEQKVQEIGGKNADNDEVFDIPSLPDLHEIDLEGDHKGKLQIGSKDLLETTGELEEYEELVQPSKMLVPETPVEAAKPQTRSKEPAPEAHKTMIRGNKEAAKQDRVGSISKRLSTPKDLALQKGPASTSTPNTKKTGPKPETSPTEPTKKGKTETKEPVALPQIIAEADFADVIPVQEEADLLEAVVAEEAAEIVEEAVEATQLPEDNLPNTPSAPVEIQVIETYEENLPQAMLVPATEPNKQPPPVSKQPPATSVATAPEKAKPSEPAAPVATPASQQEVVEIEEINSEPGDFASESPLHLDAVTSQEQELIAVDKLLAQNKIVGGETLLKAKKALEHTNFDEALQLLSVCIDTGEDIGAAYYLRALLYIQKKAWILAIEDLRNAIEFSYQDMDVEDLLNRVLLQQAAEYRNMGAYREALHALEHIASKNTDVEKGKIYWARAKFLIQVGASESALHDLEEAILKGYLKPEIFETRGKIYLEQGDYESAMHDFVVAVNRGGKSASLYQARSEAYFFLHELDAALNDIHLAQSLSPDDPLLYDFEGLILSEKKMYEASDSAFEKAFGIEPDNTMHYFNRAICYMRRGRYDRAIDDFGKVIAANPKDRLACFKRAICYQEKSSPNLALAREDFRRTEVLEQNSWYQYIKTQSKKRKEMR